MSNISKTMTEIVIPEDKLEYLQKELTNIREEFQGNKYVQEAIKVLAAGGLRSTIGSYWNAVVDDIRKKVIHRSLDLFNKEVKPAKEIKSYEDFQNHLTDHDLIEGAFKIGVISWEGRKLLQQARETRNIFDGHPDSSDPTLFKVFNMISDCNRYVLSQEYPPPIIDVNEYILVMDTDTYHKNDVAVEQAFSDLPEIYKGEMGNKFFTLYIGEDASTRLRGNMEFSFPILWKVLPKEIRQQLGKRFDKLMVEGNSGKIDKAIDLLTLVDGLRYISEASRKIIYEPAIKDLEDHLDQWSEEAKAVRFLQKLGAVIPDNLIDRLVSALTLTYVGYKGSSYSYSRSDFYSNSAAPKISEMFEKFDNRSIAAFVNTVKTDETLKSRIRYMGQLNRLRTLADILLNKPEIREESREFLELLVDEEKTKEFLYEIKK